jgi:hypothetical protein
MAILDALKLAATRKIGASRYSRRDQIPSIPCGLKPTKTTGKNLSRTTTALTRARKDKPMDEIDQSKPVDERRIVLPLPWWHHDRSQYADWGWIRDADGNLVAHVKVPRECDEAKHRREKTDPTEPISMLIAAAPEMVEELIQCEAILSLGPWNGTLNRVREVLTKALGPDWQNSKDSLPELGDLS